MRLGVGRQYDTLAGRRQCHSLQSGVTPWQRSNPRPGRFSMHDLSRRATGEVNEFRLSGDYWAIWVSSQDVPRRSSVIRSFTTRVPPKVAPEISVVVPLSCTSAVLPATRRSVSFQRVL